MNLNQRASGVLLHITSLPGPHGVGDFGPDAYRFVDWLASAGQRLWQLLPTTPIGPGHSPYQSDSAFAGSPLMVALEPLVLAGWLAPPELPQGGFDAHQVEFARVVPWRLTQLRAAAAGFFAKAGSIDRAAFNTWCKAQSYWLDDYVLFKALESAHGGQAWWDWMPAVREREHLALVEARQQHAQEIAFWQFVQWQFDVQAGELKSYARQCGVFLMGDLPIFIAHHSADCWARPDLYFLDRNYQPTVVAGVPPDAMSHDGQRWGNPLYRWDRMAAEGYAWWTMRARRALEQADVFRIDHFRGFAGYYEISASSATAKDGRWVPGPGKALFDAIAKAVGDLPIVAEDLGLITPDVIALRHACGFPGMKVMQFAFGGEGDHEYLPHMWERACVAYIGTHDNDTVHGWWQSISARERAFAGAYLGCGADDVHSAMMRSCSNSVANLVVFQLQDVLGLESRHRMNTPGTLGGGNWAWRFDWDMMGKDPTQALGHITAASGRGPFQLLHLAG